MKILIALFLLTSACFADVNYIEIPGKIKPPDTKISFYYYFGEKPLIELHSDNEFYIDGKICKDDKEIVRRIKKAMSNYLKNNTLYGGDL